VASDCDPATYVYRVQNIKNNISDLSFKISIITLNIHDLNAAYKKQLGKVGFKV
jgi:hypothetical protein